MAGSVNRVILIGNLGHDPSLRYTTSGAPVCSLSVATNERWKDKQGQPQERTEWHRIVIWGKQAEACAEHLDKGRSVYVEGRLQTRDWETREGEKRKTTEIVASNVQFLSGPSEKTENAPPREQPEEEPDEDELGWTEL